MVSNTGLDAATAVAKRFDRAKEVPQPAARTTSRRPDGEPNGGRRGERSRSERPAGARVDGGHRALHTRSVLVIYRFDCFELDASQYRLTRDRAAISIKPAVFELLRYLIEHRDRVVDKPELFSELWAGRFVGDGVLAAAVHEARRALGDDAAHSRFIRTLHGRGYQFHFRPTEVVASEERPLGAAESGSYLAWTGGPTQLRAGENGIGRDPASVIVLDGLRVSRHHARIVLSEEGAILEDLGSKNGTRLNRTRVSSTVALREGDVIEIGGVALIFRSRLADLSTLTHESSYPS